MSNNEDKNHEIYSRAYHETVKRLKAENAEKEQARLKFEAAKDYVGKPTEKEFTAMNGQQLTEAEISSRATKVAEMRMAKQQAMEATGLLRDAKAEKIEHAKQEALKIQKEIKERNEKKKQLERDNQQGRTND